MKGPISASLLVFLGLSCGGDSGQVNTPELPPQKEVATITPNPATAGMAWLRAHVLLDSTGEPVPEIRVRLLWKDDLNDMGRAFETTDSEGRCSFEVQAGTFVQSIAVSPTPSTAPSAKVIKKPVLAGADMEFEFRLQPGGVVSGQVLDSMGKPIVEADIHLWFKKKEKLAQKPEASVDLLSKTHEGGTFTLGGIPEGPFILEAIAEERVCVQRVGGEIKSGQVLDGLELLMEPSNTVSGMALGSDGETVQAALVVAGMVGRHARRDSTHHQGIYYFPVRQQVVYSDVDGSFTLNSVPISQVWAVEAKHLDYQPLRSRLLPGTGSLDIEMIRGYRLGGVVHDENGNPVSKAYLRLRGEQDRERRSQRNGLFQFKGLFADLEAALLVYSPGYAVTSIWPLNLEDGNESLEILLQQGEIVAGQLLNASGSPLPNMRIEVVLPEMKAPNNAEFPGGHPWREFGLGVTQSGPDGAFFLSDLPSGTHLLRAFQADGVQVGEIEVEAGDESVSWISP